MNDDVSITVIAPDGIWRCGFESRASTNKLNTENIMFKKSVRKENNYYSYNGELYRVCFEDDNNGEVCAFNGWYNNFEEWHIKHFSSLHNLPFDINKATKVEPKDLDIAIEKIKSDCKKKFDDFKLDGTLYTNKGEFTGEYFYKPYKTFPSIARPKKKLVYENSDTVRQKYILEIEIIDGIEAKSKRKFILFHEFIMNYTPGCDVNVVDTDDSFEKFNELKLENYFDQNYNEISEDEALPF